MPSQQLRCAKGMQGTAIGLKKMGVPAYEYDSDGKSRHPAISRIERKSEHDLPSCTIPFRPTRIMRPGKNSSQGTTRGNIMH